jgi:hypothetical protein
MFYKLLIFTMQFDILASQYLHLAFRLLTVTNVLLQLNLFNFVALQSFKELSVQIKILRDATLCSILAVSERLKPFEDEARLHFI